MDTPESTCRCCSAGQPFTRPRTCPECGHEFQGSGWDGIDAHWRSRHEGVMTYGSFGSGLCTRDRDTTEPGITRDDVEPADAQTINTIKAYANLLEYVLQRAKRATRTEHAALKAS